MGAECRNVKGPSLAAQFTFSQPIQHPVFGNILHLKSDKIQKAIKKVPYRSSLMNMQAIRRRIQFSKDCDGAVSTLVQVYDYTMMSGKNGREEQVWSIPQEKVHLLQKQQSSLFIHFQYLPPENSLASIIFSHQSHILKIKTRMGAGFTSAIKSVRLCDYFQIDRLPSQQRQIVNHYFQEIQVVRMIDHLVGALYLLHHYQIPHGGIRPQCILVDHEGKYLLADRELFMLPSNYSAAMDYVNTRQNGGSGVKEEIGWLAPEWLEGLREGRHDEGLEEKGEIFCLGLLALKMCLIDSNQILFDYSPLSKTFIFHQQILRTQLTYLKNRYSKQLVALLQKMLKVDPQQRLDFGQLIDELNTVLLKNLQTIKQLHSPLIQPKSSNKSCVSQERTVLKESLINMQDNFQKVMRNRTLMFNRNVNQKQLREEEEEILGKLQQLKMAKSGMRTQANSNQKQSYPHPHPKVQTFQLHPKSPISEKQRYVSGRELQQIVWRQYQNLKNSHHPS